MDQATLPLFSRGERSWGAHAPRVLVAAPRRNHLFGKSSRWRGRHRQHARRVRSPAMKFASLHFFHDSIKAIGFFVAAQNVEALNRLAARAFEEIIFRAHHDQPASARIEAPRNLDEV